MKAPGPAEAILESDIYKNSTAWKKWPPKGRGGHLRIAVYMEKRSNVELLLRAPEFDAEKGCRSRQELEDANKAMNACPMVNAHAEAQQRFQEMMDNVTDSALVITLRGGGRRFRRSGQPALLAAAAALIGLQTNETAGQSWLV